MRAFVSYALLVGIPAAGVIGVLETGKDLAAPPHVGGSWQVTIAPDSSCHSPHSVDSLSLTIQQSGPHLELVFADSLGTHLRGEVSGAAFQASNADGIELQASLRPGEGVMSGTLVGIPCAGTSVLEGARTVAPARKGAP